VNQTFEVLEDYFLIDVGYDDAGEDVSYLIVLDDFVLLLVFYDTVNVDLEEEHDIRSLDDVEAVI
jgi:hypothetical protein